MKIPPNTPPPVNFHSSPIPLVTQNLARRLRESALKSTTAGFANAPVLSQYEGVCDRQFQGTLTQPTSQILSHERYIRQCSVCLTGKRVLWAHRFSKTEKITHDVCVPCLRKLSECPVCQGPITTRPKQEKKIPRKLEDTGTAPRRIGKLLTNVPDLFPTRDPSTFDCHYFGRSNHRYSLKSSRSITDPISSSVDSETCEQWLTHIEAMIRTLDKEIAAIQSQKRRKRCDQILKPVLAITGIACLAFAMLSPEFKLK